jgi:hypothetical protein
VIPGYKRPITDLLYECVAIPDTLTGPPTVLNQSDYSPNPVLDVDAALIRRPAVFVPGGRVYYLYGCATVPAEGIQGGIFDAGTSTFLPNISPATLDNCAAQCHAQDFNSFAMVNGQ